MEKGQILQFPEMDPEPPAEAVARQFIFEAAWKAAQNGYDYGSIVEALRAEADLLERSFLKKR